MHPEVYSLVLTLKTYFSMPRILKNLPKNLNYLYTTEDVFGLHKLYKSKKQIYLVSITSEGQVIRSYTPKELLSLSSKLYDYAEQLPHEESNQD